MILNLHERWLLRRLGVLAAALHQAGLSAADYRAGTAAGLRTLAQFREAKR